MVWVVGVKGLGEWGVWTRAVGGRWADGVRD